MGRFAVVFCWVIALLMSASMSARASTVDWLYDVDVPVTDQSAEVRSAAFRQALLVALKRITGLNDVPTTPAVTSALEAPQRYLRRIPVSRSRQSGRRRAAAKSADVVGAIRGERDSEARGGSRPAAVEFEPADHARVDRRQRRCEPLGAGRERQESAAEQRPRACERARLAVAVSGHGSRRSIGRDRQRGGKRGVVAVPSSGRPSATGRTRYSSGASCTAPTTRGRWTGS